MHISFVSKAVFNKAPTEGVTWKFIGWVLIFVAFLTTINFVIWLVRSKEKVEVKKENVPGEEDNKSSVEKK